LLAATLGAYGKPEEMLGNKTIVGEIVQEKGCSTRLKDEQDRASFVHVTIFIHTFVTFLFCCAFLFFLTLTPWSVHHSTNLSSAGVNTGAMQCETVVTHRDYFVHAISMTNYDFARVQ